MASKWDSRDGRGYGDDQDWTKMLPRCERTEKELFKSGQNSGINFEKYDDIPAESTGEEPPEAVDTFEDCDLGKYYQNNFTKKNCKNFR